MKHAALRWLFTLGALAGVGALLLSQSVAAGASPARAGASARASARYVPPRQLLSLGLHGPAVRRLQARLAALKYYPGPLDGRFGWATDPEGNRFELWEPK